MASLLATPRAARIEPIPPKYDDAPRGSRSQDYVRDRSHLLPHRLDYAKPRGPDRCGAGSVPVWFFAGRRLSRSEEHTSELQSRLHLVCRLLLEKKKEFKNATRMCVCETSAH